MPRVSVPLTLLAGALDLLLLSLTIMICAEVVSRFVSHCTIRLPCLL